MPDTLIKYVIVEEGHDLHFFKKKRVAENSMEAIDVKDGVYSGYDAKGRLLKIVPRGPNSQIELAEYKPTYADELCILISTFLTRTGDNLESKKLSDLLKVCEKHIEDY